MRKLLTLTMIAAAGLATVAIETPAAAQRPTRVVCESYGRGQTVCPMRVRDGVRLTRQLSDRRCVRGRTWDVVRGAIVVRRGCRGVFRSNRY